MPVPVVRPTKVPPVVPPMPVPVVQPKRTVPVAMLQLPVVQPKNQPPMPLLPRLVQVVPLPLDFVGQLFNKPD